MAVQCEVTGVAAMPHKLERLIAVPLEPLSQALRLKGHLIMQQAKALVPVDTGVLRSTGGVESGALETPRCPGGVVEVTLRDGAHGTAALSFTVWDNGLPSRVVVVSGQVDPTTSTVTIPLLLG